MTREENQEESKCRLQRSTPSVSFEKLDVPELQDQASVDVNRYRWMGGMHRPGDSR